MFIEERHQEIAEIIHQNGKILISEITDKYGISDESARRDLRILEQKGACKRTHGGAIKLQQVGARPPVDRSFEKMPVYDNYKAIAREAAKNIRENDIIYLTSGSLGYIMLSFLPKDIQYTVVVNSVDLAKEFRVWENVDVYVVGGRMRSSGSIADSLATEFVSRIHFDVCFITGAGLTAEFGLSNGTDETAAFQRMIIENSRRRVLLMPSEKAGINAFIKVCDANRFNTVITDWNITEDQVLAFEEQRLEVVVVEK